MPATATAYDPETIEAEISDLEDRLDRLREKRESVEEDLQDARSALQTAEDEEAQDEALDEAERLQLQSDTLTEAIDDVEVEIETHRERLADARAEQEKEKRLEALAQKGKEAVEKRSEYEAVRDEILDVLREKAPALAARFSAWLDAAEDFRSALRSTEQAVYEMTGTSETDEARAEQLIGELKERGVCPFLRALAPFHAGGDARRWKGWDHGEDGLDGPLKSAVESVRSFGNQSAQSHE